MPPTPCAPSSASCAAACAAAAAFGAPCTLGFGAFVVLSSFALSLIFEERFGSSEGRALDGLALLSRSGSVVVDCRFGPEIGERVTCASSSSPRSEERGEEQVDLAL